MIGCANRKVCARTFEMTLKLSYITFTFPSTVSPYACDISTCQRSAFETSCSSEVESRRGALKALAALFWQRQWWRRPLRQPQGHYMLIFSPAIETLRGARSITPPTPRLSTHSSLSAVSRSRWIVPPVLSPRRECRVRRPSFEKEHHDFPQL